MLPPLSLSGMYVKVTSLTLVVSNTILICRLSGFLVFWLFAFLVIDAKEQPADFQKDEIQGDQEGQENKQTQKKMRTKMVSFITLIDSINSNFF